MRHTLVLVGALLAGAPVAAQQAADSAAPRPGPVRVPGRVVVDSRGIVFEAPDSTAELWMRFRMQLLATAEDGADGGPGAGGQVRRLRLRFGGWLLDPRLTMNLQLSFARGDLDFDDTDVPNIVRDAAVSYQAVPNLRLTFGQTKLPGNRQRVISSGDLQSAERSIVNARFNIDRDFLLMASLRDTVAGKVPVFLSGAVSSGEGRNSPVVASGLAYTGRVEIQPFGPFTRSGEDFEGDLEHEPRPKLAVGVVWSRNEDARRTGGQLGPALFAPRTMETLLADVLLKYRGFALYGEVADRSAADPVTTSGTLAPRAIYVGRGVLGQASWYHKRTGLEPGVRWAVTDPDPVLAGLAGSERQEQAAVWITKYLRRHRVRTHAEFGWLDARNEATLLETRTWIGRLNFEFGI